MQGRRAAARRHTTEGGWDAGLQAGGGERARACRRSVGRASGPGKRRRETRAYERRGSSRTGWLRLSRRRGSPLARRLAALGQAAISFPTLDAAASTRRQSREELPCCESRCSAVLLRSTHLTLRALLALRRVARRVRVLCCVLTCAAIASTHLGRRSHSSAHARSPQGDAIALTFQRRTAVSLFPNPSIVSQALSNIPEAVAGAKCCDAAMH